MFTTLPITLAFVASLVATSATAAPLTEESQQPKIISIAVSKRGPPRSHFIADTDELDFVSIGSHIQTIKNKYAVTKSNLAIFNGKAKRAGGTSLIPLTPQDQNSYWSGVVKFGGKSVAVDFDTGSSDTLLDADAYTPSSSATNTGKTFRNSYGSASDPNSFSGTIYQDTFSSGDLSLQKASIGRVTSGKEIVPGVDGLVGLGYPAISSFGSKYPPLFDALINENQLAVKEFGFALATSGATLDLGGYDSSKYTGEIEYTPVTRQAYWQVPGTINGQSFSSIVDSGTTLIVGPTGEVQTFFNSLSGVQSFSQAGDLYGAYECNSPPKVTFKFGSSTINLTADSTRYGRTNDGRCVLSIIGTNVGQPAWITGDPLFLSSYVAFSRSQNAVGFAARK